MGEAKNPGPRGHKWHDGIVPECVDCHNDEQIVSSGCVLVDHDMRKIWANERWKEDRQNTLEMAKGQVEEKDGFSHRAAARRETLEESGCKKMRDSMMKLLGTSEYEDKRRRKRKFVIWFSYLLNGSEEWVQPEERTVNRWPIYPEDLSHSDQVDVATAAVKFWRSYDE